MFHTENFDFPTAIGVSVIFNRNFLLRVILNFFFVFFSSRFSVLCIFDSQRGSFCEFTGEMYKSDTQ